jgi:hypothetical protein
MLISFPRSLSLSATTTLAPTTIAPTTHSPGGTCLNNSFSLHPASPHTVTPMHRLDSVPRQVLPRDAAAADVGGRRDTVPQHGRPPGQRYHRRRRLCAGAGLCVFVCVSVCVYVCVCVCVLLTLFARAGSAGAAVRQQLYAGLGRRYGHFGEIERKSELQALFLCCSRVCIAEHTDALGVG